MCHHISSPSIALALNAGPETERLLIDAPLDGLFNPLKGSATDKEDVCRVDLHVFLLRMLTPALRGDISDSSFKNLEECLLHTFAGDVARDTGAL